MTAIKFFLGKYLTAIELVVIALLLAGFGLQTVRLSAAKTEFAQLETSIARERQAGAEQRERDERDARTTEQGLFQAASDNRKEANEKQRALAARVADLRSQLRNRPERPAPGSEVAPAACPGSCGTGAGLYREDSTFLVGEAASAAQVGVERDQCRSQYSAAREALSKGQPK
jgi:hypothetical protein